MADNAVHLRLPADQDGHVELQLALVVGQAGLDVVGEDVEHLAGQRAVLGLGADAGVGGNIIQGAGFFTQT